MMTRPLNDTAPAYSPQRLEPMLVAVRDSSVDHSAVEWAAARAVLLRAPMTLLHAVADPALMPPDAPYQEVVAAGRALISNAAARVLRDHPGLRIGTYLHCGGVVEALLGLAEVVPMIVVGADRKDPDSGEFQGSVALQVALNASATVVVVPPEHAYAAAGGQHRGGVVVGVDGSELSHLCLMRAAEEASLLATALTVVTALSSLSGPMSVNSSTMLSEVRARFPRLVVTWIVDDLRAPVEALVAHGVGSDLLVIGRHGSGARTDMSLGSVTHRLLLEPPCSTLVITRREPELPAGETGQGAA